MTVKKTRESWVEVLGMSRALARSISELPQGSMILAVFFIVGTRSPRYFFRPDLFAACRKGGSQ